MKKLSKIQASQRILKIAKQVAIVQASNKKLTPLELAKVQKSVGLILASTDMDEQTLTAIEQLEKQAADDNGNISPNKVMQQLMQNKQVINKQKNKQMKSSSGVKQFLSANGIRLTKPMKVGKFFQIIKQLLLNYESISNPQEQLDEE